MSIGALCFSKITHRPHTVSTNSDHERITAKATVLGIIVAKVWSITGFEVYLFATKLGLQVPTTLPGISFSSNHPTNRLQLVLITEEMDHKFNICIMNEARREDHGECGIGFFLQSEGWILEEKPYLCLPSNNLMLDGVTNHQTLCNYDTTFSVRSSPKASQAARSRLLTDGIPAWNVPSFRLQIGQLGVHPEKRLRCKFGLSEEWLAMKMAQSSNMSRTSLVYQPLRCLIYNLSRSISAFNPPLVPIQQFSTAKFLYMWKAGSEDAISKRRADPIGVFDA
ncbi:hypothetical protein BDP27DRAFT_1372317 [Rhodocollybia butyracea]|uniref:Uncharacterized protein n=1 Tax=Rhodocollybia butyracea TaxID=206335 RepID=A0A9P5P8W1_9AGAR|nr:hypothetical protein BDP27DRAFT_1372317 [Rhodocollybia butyracea]